VEAPHGKEALTILRRLIAYSEKVFQFSVTVINGVVDRRPQPRIPTAVFVKSVAVLFWARMGSLNALELTAHSSFFRVWLGQSVCSADSIGRIHALIDAEGLRQGIHHVYDRLKRNKALPDHHGIGIAVLTAAVDPWSGDPPFQLELAPAGGRPTLTTFTDRAEWLASYRRHRAEPLTAAAARTGTP